MAKKLTPREEIIARALDVLASVSKNRLTLAVSAKPQSSVLVNPFAFGRLAVEMEKVYPGAIAHVREAAEAARREYIARMEQEKAAKHAAYLAAKAEEVKT